MAKRFTDSSKWKKPFFKGLSTVDKLFFLYLLDNCDHAGVWDVEMDVACLRIGEKLNPAELLQKFNGYVHVFDNYEKWFIPAFVEFQYGTLNLAVNAHKSVISILRKRGLVEIYEQFIKSSLTLKDKDKDMDKDKDKDKEEKFQLFWNLYPRKLDKKKAKVRFLTIIAKDVLLAGIIITAVERQVKAGMLKPKDEFTKHPKSWLNGECWTNEIISNGSTPFQADAKIIQELEEEETDNG